MKINCLILALFVSFAAFGQMPEEDACHLNLRFPDASFFSNTHYNHFEELFPPEKMKANGTKTIIIKKADKDNTLSLHIGAKDSTTYRLNENGAVINYDYGGYRFIEYDRNDENLILSKRDSLAYSDKSYKTNLYEYDYEASNLVFTLATFKQSVANKEIIQHFTYSYDNQNRMTEQLIENHFGWTMKDYATFITYEYDTEKYFQTVKNNKKEGTTDTTFFDKQWRPIQQKYYRNNELIYSYELVYDMNNKISSYQYTAVYEPSYNYTLDFHYNTNGLLEKIIKTTNDGTCEFQVYYYTE